MLKIFLLFIISIATIQSEAKIEIAIQPADYHEVVAGKVVYLEDLLETNAANESLPTSIRTLQLFEPLFDGEEKTVTHAEMMRLLKEKIKTDEYGANFPYSFFVSETIKIKAIKNSVTETKLQKLILKAAFAKCLTCQFKIHDLKIPNIENKSELYSFELDTANLKIAGGFLLPLRMQFENQEKIVYITGGLQTKMPALISARSIAMGEKIRPEDFKKEEIEIVYAADAFATEEDLKGRVLNKTLSLGRPVYKSDLKKEMVIGRGQIVRALSGNDDFEVTNQMIAEEPGAIGDTVKLKNPETQKMISGEVIEKGLVRIQ